MMTVSQKMRNFLQPDNIFLEPAAAGAVAAGTVIQNRETEASGIICDDELAPEL